MAKGIRLRRPMAVLSLLASAAYSIGAIPQIPARAAQTSLTAANAASPATAPAMAVGCAASSLALGTYSDTTVAMKTDGSAATWGQNNAGQLGNGSVDSTGTQANPTPGPVNGSGGTGVLGGLASVAAGTSNMGAVSASDGTVWTWGYQYTIAGPAQYNTSPVKEVGPGGSGFLSGVVQLVITDDVYVALRNDGTVWAWGDNRNGEAGNGAILINNPNLAVLVPTQVVGIGGNGFLTGVVALSGGATHVLALESNGSVVAWGTNGFGELGNNDPNGTTSSVPVQVLGPGGAGSLSNVVGIAAGDRYSLAVTASGNVWAWGRNQEGELGVGTTDRNSHPTPMAVPGPGGVGVLSGATQVAAGQQFAAVRKFDGTAWTWGSGSFGELGNGDTAQNNQFFPVQVQDPAGGPLQNVSAVQAGWGYASAVRSNGTVWSWGWNYYGQLGQGTHDTSPHVLPGEVLDVGGSGFLTVSSTGSCFPKRVAQCLTSPFSIGNISAYTNALMFDGTVQSWGINGDGQLANGGTTNSAVPVVGSGLSGVVSVAGGSTQSTALLSNGTVLSWGRAPLGDGTNNNSLTPVQVLDATGTAPLSGVIAIAEGDRATYALKQDGTVWSWGSNGEGELGNGTTSGGSVLPVQVVSSTGSGGLTGIVEIVAGTDQALALQSNGAVWAWGDNRFGDLGTNKTGSSGTPAQVVGPDGNGLFSDAVDIAAGQYYSMALRSDGTVWSWGGNNGGVLGTGLTDNQGHPLPTEVLGPGGNGYLTGIIQISGSEEHSAAVSFNGTVWTWGQNTAGELGNGDQGQIPSPVPVAVVAPGGGSLSDVSHVSGGEFFGAALKSDGTVWTWGYNQFDQLGIGSADINVHSVPAEVVGKDGTGSLSGVAQPLACAPPVKPPPPPPPPPGPTPEATTAGGSPSTTPTTPQCGSYPINCLTGEFWHVFEDMKILGRGAYLDLTRSYSAASAARNGPLGFGWTHSYNMSLAVDGTSGAVTVTEESGSSLVFTSTGTGYEPRSWVFATLARNPDGSWTFTRKDQRQYIFDSSGRLMQEVDRNGYTTTLAYNTGGKLVTITDPAGRALVLGYDSNGRVISVTDPLGRKVAYLFDASGNLASVTDVGGGVTGFTYDSNHRLLTMTDPNGGVLTNTYDSNGRVVSQQDPMGRVTQYAYGSGSTTITHAAGDITLEQFQNNELVSMTRAPGTPQAATWSYVYDQSNLCVTSATDPNNHVWKRSCDANGNLLSVTDPLARAVSFTYDSRNNLASMLDGIGNKTVLSYDSSSNLIKSVRGAGGTSQQVVSYSLDQAHPGDISSITDANGQVWQMSYDQYGDAVKVTDPLGDASTYTYDAGGRLLTMVSANGNVPGASPSAYTTTYSYDAFNDPVTQVDPLGRRVSIQYDANRNRVAVTDGNGGVTKQGYDLDNEPVSAVNADGSSTTYVYDADGGLSSQKDALGHVTTYGYDGVHRLTSTVDPLNRKTTVAYDPAGNRTTLTDAMSRTTTFKYDAANELTGLTYSDGKTPNVALLYDANGRRTTMSDGSGTTTYSYDPLGRLTQVVDGAGHSVGYAFDLNSNLTTLSYPDGSHVQRAYDAANRLTSVTDWLGHKTSLAYDADGNLTKQTYPNTVTAALSYDAADQLKGITDSGPMGTLSLTYGFDKNGSLTAENVAGEPPSGPIAYGYNGMNRLASDNFGIFQQSFQYDAVGRLTQAAVTDSKGTRTSTLNYDAANQLLGLTQVQGSKLLKQWQFAYDPVGDRVQRSDQAGLVTTYGYDQAGRLTTYGSSAIYSYNGDGLRTKKTVGGVAESFTWDMAGGLPVILQDGATRYVTGMNGLPLEQIAADGTVRYYHQDQLGSTRALTNAAGKIDATALYDPYGNLVASSGSVSNPFGFAGQYTDAESGLVYMRARYYDPSTASFISRDPVASVDGRGYGYAKDSPLNYVDPTGRWPGVNAVWNFFWQGAQYFTIVTTFFGFIFERIGMFGVAAAFDAATVVFGAVASIKAAVEGDILKAFFEMGGTLLGEFKYLIPSVSRLVPALAEFARGGDITGLVTDAWAAVKEMFNFGDVVVALQRLADLAGEISGGLSLLFHGIAAVIIGAESLVDALIPTPTAVPSAPPPPAQPAPC